MPPSPRTGAQAPRVVSQPLPRRIDGLRVIALLKFGKALLLLVTGYGVHLLLNVDLLERLHAWTAQLTDSYEQRLLLHALTWVESLGAKRIHVVEAVTLSYTAVVLAEGTGLWLRRAWAEWLTVIATASLIPFELWELIKRPPGQRLAVLGTLALNLVILGYLTWLLRRAAKTQRSQASDSSSAGA